MAVVELALLDCIGFTAGIGDTAPPISVVSFGGGGAFAVSDESASVSTHCSKTYQCK